MSTSSCKAVFDFTGKSGIHRRVELKDHRLARLIKACQHLPGQHLCRYEDEDGKRHDISSTDVKDYLHQIAGEGFIAKDFRTWAGTVLAARALQKIASESPGNKSAPQKKLQLLQKKNIVRAIESVAKQLGNTPAICKCYVHPVILNAYLDGSLVRTLQQRTATAHGPAPIIRLLSHAAKASIAR